MNAHIAEEIWADYGMMKRNLYVIINGDERNFLDWRKLFGVVILNSDCRGNGVGKYNYIRKAKLVKHYGIVKKDAVERWNQVD